MVELIRGNDHKVDISKINEDILATRTNIKDIIARHNEIINLVKCGRRQEADQKAYLSISKQWRATCRHSDAHTYEHSPTWLKDPKKELGAINKIFDGMLKDIDTFERRRKENKLKEGDFLPVVIFNGKEQYYPYTIYTYRVPDSEQCKVCNLFVRRVQMPKHVKTDACIEAGKQKERIAAKLVHTRIPKLVGLAKRGLIPHDKTAIKWEWYVPTWVIESLELYEKNKGYAGMKFEEFIARQQHQEKVK